MLSILKNTRQKIALVDPEEAMGHSALAAGPPGHSAPAVAPPGLQGASQRFLDGPHLEGEALLLGALRHDALAAEENLAGHLAERKP